MIPARGRRGVRAALEEAGVEHELVIYPGAPHSFFDRKQEQFADASEDAWNRVLAFISGTRSRASACGVLLAELPVARGRVRSRLLGLRRAGDHGRDRGLGGKAAERERRAA